VSKTTQKTKREIKVDLYFTCLPTTEIYAQAFDGGEYDIIKVYHHEFNKMIVSY
jgi:hypothetical protein